MVLRKKVCACVCVRAQSLQSCLTVCDPVDYSPPGSSVRGIFQARIPEWAAMPSSRALPDPGIELASLTSPALARGFFITRRPGKPKVYTSI